LAFCERWGENVSSLRDTFRAHASDLRHAEEHGVTVKEWMQAATNDLSKRASEASQRYRHRLANFHVAGDFLGANRIACWASAGLVRWNSTGKRQFLTTRSHLNSYWRQLRDWFRRGRLIRLSFETPRIVLNVLRETRLSATFAVYFLRELTCD